MATAAQVGSTATNADRSAHSSEWSIAVTVFASGYLFLRLFRGFTPILLTGDQVFFWSYGQRLGHGQLPYRDFFQITGPASDALFAFVFRVFGESLWAANIVVLVLGVALTLTVFHLARTFATEAISACIAVLYALKVYGRYLSATHHFLSMLAIGLALLVLIREPRRRGMVLAGTLLGAAAITTQTHAVFAALAITLTLLVNPSGRPKERIQRCGQLWSGMLLVVVPVEGLLAAKVGIAQLWYCQVTVPSRWPGSSASSAWWSEGSGKDFVELILLYALPCVAYALSARRILRGEMRRRFPTLLLLLVGLALGAEVLTAPNALRILAVSLPAFALLGYLLQNVARRRAVVGLVAAVLIVPVARSIWSAQRGELRVVTLPAGRAAAPPALAQKLDWLQAHAGPEDEILEAAYPGVYLPLRRLDPLYADNLMPIRLTPAEIADRSVRELERHKVKYIVWNDALEAEPPSETRAAFKSFREYVRSNYNLALDLGNGETILARR